jgi:hypothetical protein
MALLHFALASTIAPLVAGYLTSPPGSPGPDTNSDCSGWVQYSSGLTCTAVEQKYGITEAQFEAWVSKGVALINIENSLINCRTLSSQNLARAVLFRVNFAIACRSTLSLLQFLTRNLLRH